MLHSLLRYLGLPCGASCRSHLSLLFDAERALDAVFAAARAANPKVWGLNSSHIPSRQRKIEHFALWLAVAMPPQPAARRTLIEAAITRLAIGLREAGVGDMGVSKEVRTLAGALNGRLQSYLNHIKNNDINSFIKSASAHTIPTPEAKTAWASLHLKPTPKVKKLTKKTLPSPAKPAKSKPIQ
jgi:hypothetical protein